jgi:hypothetical protein
MIGVELAELRVVEDNVASSLVGLCSRPFRDDGGPLQAECLAPRRR